MFERRQLEIYGRLTPCRVGRTARILVSMAQNIFLKIVGFVRDGVKIGPFQPRYGKPGSRFPFWGNWPHLLCRQPDGARLMAESLFPDKGGLCGAGTGFSPVFTRAAYPDFSRSTPPEYRPSIRLAALSSFRRIWGRFYLQYGIALVYRAGFAKFPSLTQESNNIVGR